MTLEQIEKRRASQRTPEYKAKKRIRDREYARKRGVKPRVKLYASEKEQKKAHKKRLYQKNTDFILEYKKDKCCADCGWKKHPEILQFHHIRNKLENISALRKKSIPRIKTEIEKCMLLCPNCHFWLHYVIHRHRRNFKEK